MFPYSGSDSPMPESFAKLHALVLLQELGLEVLTRTRPQCLNQFLAPKV
jgi:hypothetical protein